MNIKGTKLKMTQIWRENGEVVPVTLIKTESGEFKSGDQITVKGISRGKGFQGVVKRWSFSGGPKTHGQKNRHRAPGSIGNTSPQRVVKGRKMAGRTGGKTITLKNLEVINIDEKNKILGVKGAIPGGNGSKVTLKTSP